MECQIKAGQQVVVTGFTGEIGRRQAFVHVDRNVVVIFPNGSVTSCVRTGENVSGFVAQAGQDVKRHITQLTIQGDLEVCSYSFFSYEAVFCLFQRCRQDSGVTVNIHCRFVQFCCVSNKAVTWERREIVEFTLQIERLDQVAELAGVIRIPVTQGYVARSVSESTRLHITSFQTEIKTTAAFKLKATVKFGLSHSGLLISLVQVKHGGTNVARVNDTVAVCPTSRQGVVVLIENCRQLATEPPFPLNNGRRTQCHPYRSCTMWTGTAAVHFRIMHVQFQG